MDCKNSILDETFGQHLAASPPQIALQLQTILSRMAAQDDRINDLEATNAALVARLAVLEATSAPPAEIATGEVQTLQQVTPPPDIAILGEIIQLRADMEMFNESRALEIAEDRGRLRALETPPEVHVQPKQRNQGDILRALLASTGNGKMLQSAARSKMGISKSAFSRLLLTLEGRVRHEPYHRDRRQNVLILINKKS